jgi:hypothetical protein
MTGSVLRRVACFGAITMSMDLAAVVVALAFTYRWGERLPAWLVLPPIWVATGLLAPITLGVPLGSLVQALAGGSPVTPDNGLRGWVYAVVYGGFIVQAIMLLATFGFYARSRWAEVFRLRVMDLPAVSAWQLRIADVAAVVAIGYGVLHVVWALSGGGFGGDPASVQTALQKTFWAVQGPLSMVGAAGVLTLAHRWGHGRLLVPLASAWVGTGVVFASGLYAAMVAAGSSMVRFPVLVLCAGTGLLMAALVVRLLSWRSSDPRQGRIAIRTAAGDRELIV